MKDTVIVGTAGRFYKLTPKAIEFLEELDNLAEKHGIDKEEIPKHLEELAKRILEEKKG